MTKSVFDFYRLSGTVRLMDSALMPREGRYMNRQICPQKFRALMWLADYEGKLISYIECKATVQVLRDFTGLAPEPNHSRMEIQDRDLLLCVRLKCRVEDVCPKRHQEPSLADYEFFACRYEAESEPS